MEKKFISQKLNLVAASAYSKKGGSPFTFYQGNASGMLKSVVRSVAPYGKVIALYTQKSYLKRGMEFADALSGVCSKVLGVIVSDKTDIVKAAAQILRAPEDVRAVITSDHSLSPLASYVAKAVKVPYIYIMVTPRTEGILSPRLLLKNGDRADCVPINIKRHIIIDADEVEKASVIPASSKTPARRVGAAELFITAESKIPALADYRAYLSVSGEKPDVAAYDLLREAVRDAYNSFLKKEKEIIPSLIYDCILAEIANALSGGRLCDFSALRFAEFLLSGEKRLPPEEILELYCRISGIYALFSSGMFDEILSVPDYRGRAHALSEKTNTDVHGFAEGLLKQTAAISAKADNVENTVKRLSSELGKQNESAGKVRSSYTAFGGKTLTETYGEEKAKIRTEEINAAIKLCGDSPFGVNGMSLAREKGVTEYI